MPDAQNAQQVAEALALAGANSLATAMGTDAWQLIRPQFGRIFHRRGHDPREMEGQLDRDAALVIGEDADAARAELVGPWRRRLLVLLREDPAAAAELTALIDHVRDRLPNETRHWTQTINAHGNSVVNTVVGGNQHNHYLDARRPADGEEPAEGEDVA